MKGGLRFSLQHIPAVAALSLFLAVALTGCASGPKPLDVTIPGGAVGTDVRVIAYSGSDAGEPVPSWLGQSVLDLEAAPELVGSYVFRFALEGETLDEVQARLDSFPESMSIAGAIIDRALEKGGGIEDLPDALMDRAVRIVAAAEYAGAAPAGEFWVHEELVDEEAVTARYRGWLLYSVPRDQVHAGLLLAYGNAAASFPPTTGPELAACESLQARFGDGL